MWEYKRKLGETYRLSVLSRYDDTSKVKLSLAEWKSEIENGKSEFFIGFKWLVTCIFNVLNLKPTNIGLNSSHKENKFKSCLTKQL